MLGREISALWRAKSGRTQKSAVLVTALEGQLGIWRADLERGYRSNSRQANLFGRCSRVTVLARSDVNVEGSSRRVRVVASGCVAASWYLV